MTLRPLCLIVIPLDYMEVYTRRKTFYLIDVKNVVCCCISFYLIYLFAIMVIFYSSNYYYLSKGGRGGVATLAFDIWMTWPTHSLPSFYSHLILFLTYFK